METQTKPQLKLGQQYKVQGRTLIYAGIRGEQHGFIEYCNEERTGITAVLIHRDNLRSINGDFSDSTDIGGEIFLFRGDVGFSELAKILEAKQ